MSNEPIIEINNLSKKFKKLVAVDNLSLSVEKGKIFGFLGPNGAGKSTTIRMMLTLIKQDTGTIKFFGLNNQNKDRSIFKKIGALVERPDFYLYLSAYRNLEFFSKLSGINTTRKLILDTLNMVGLGGREKDKVKTYSLGMKQRLGIAQALIHDPEIIILDEPTNGLDPKGMREVKDLLIELSNKGKTIFISSHLLSEVEILANTMAIINKGKTVVQGDVKELLNNAESNVYVEINNKLDENTLLNSKIKFLERSNNIYSFNSSKKNIPELIDFLRSLNAEIYSIKTVNSLEDYFLKITEGN